ncbi:beta-ketothiolase BktB [Antarctobacter sp.]|uniref:beta-ketothiolase BktB n=1 Tax=Antarctobacter sp. TaxID=1872577 RepID=UPI003A906180
MNDVIIASAVRTAIGDLGGALAGLPPTDLAAQVARAAIERAGCPGRDVDLSVFGHVIHTEPRDMYLSRVAAINAGVPETAPALTLNRLCGSGLQAVVTAAEAIMLDNASVALASGAESMSRAGHLLSASRFGARMGDVGAVDMMVGALTDPFGNGHMGVTAENVARDCGIDRETQDTIAVESHRRAARAIENGWFREQILPIEVTHRRETRQFTVDEHVRPGTTLEGMAGLRPAFAKGGSVTAGNASGINDGAAALVLMAAKEAERRAVEPLGRIVAYGLGGVAPGVMGLGPIPAVEQALKRAKMTVDDLDAIESNEAFAAQACAVSRRLGFPDEITNPDGGAIALGHPVGASGAIILTKLLYHLKRTGKRRGLATMCIGGGQGIAVIVERI